MRASRPAARLARDNLSAKSKCSAARASAFVWREASAGGDVGWLRG